MGQDKAVVVQPGRFQRHMIMCVLGKWSVCVMQACDKRRLFPDECAVNQKD